MTINEYIRPAIEEIVEIEFEAAICAGSYNGPINGTGVDDGGDAF